MARSRKDSRRRITVDGRVYFWRVSPDDGIIALLVRADGNRGQWLWVKFSYDDEWVQQSNDMSLSVSHRLIVPKVVRLAILEGLRRGWNPAATKPPMFRLPEGDSLLPAEEWPRRRRCT